MSQEELFALIKRELAEVRRLSIFYDRPGLKTAWHVVDNMEQAFKDEHGGLYKRPSRNWRKL